MIAQRKVAPVPELEIISRNPIGGNFEYLRVDQLHVDKVYQRQLRTEKVRKIMSEFDGTIFGVLLVSRRADGKCFVVDGQHRTVSIQRLGWTDQLVPCLVYEGLTLKDEARMFYEPQEKRSSLTPVDRFRARLVEEDPAAIRILKTCEQHGFHLNLINGETVGGQLVAIGTLDWIDRQYKPDMLGTVLRIIRDAWGGETSGVKSGVLRGLAMFHSRYQGRYEEVRLVEVLRKAVSPRRIEADGNALKSLIGCKPDEAMGMTLVRLYNHKKQTRRIPEWGDAIVKRPTSETAKAND